MQLFSCSTVQNISSVLHMPIHYMCAHCVYTMTCESIQTPDNHLSALSALSCKAPGMRAGFHHMRPAVCSSNGKKGRIKKKKEKGVNNLLLMEALLHLTSHKLCGLRARLSFISAALGFDTDEGVRASKTRKKKTEREQTTTSEGFSLSQHPKHSTRRRSESHRSQQL